MKKIEVYIILFFLLISSAKIKSQTIDEVLKIIETNNQELQAAQKLLESKTYEYKNLVLPEGPEFSYGYFPETSSNPGPKESFEIGQSFQMPGFYRNQSRLSKLLVEKEKLSYQQLRQSILGETKTLLIELVYLTRLNFLLQARLSDAENLMKAYTKRLETGDVNVLEVNKSKLYLLHIQNHLKIIQNELSSLQKQLTYYNGGKELNAVLAEYPVAEEIDMLKLISEKQMNDPELLYYLKESESSASMVKVTKNLQLPSFRLGYAGETVANEKFRGFVVGVSVPLWSGRSAIKKAKFESQYVELNSEFMQTKIIAETQVQIDKIKTLKENLDNYSSALSSINNIDLLKKSLELGEISTIEYFTEISYFYQIYDDFLLAEKEYQQSLAELLKYKL